MSIRKSIKRYFRPRVSATVDVVSVLFVFVVLVIGSQQQQQQQQQPPAQPQPQPQPESDGPPPPGQTKTAHPRANQSCQSAGADQTAGPDDANQAPPVAPGPAQARVSDFVRPNYYTLRLKLDPNKRRFTGQLMIALDVGQPAADRRRAAEPAEEPDVAGNASQWAEPGGQRYLTLHAGANIQLRKAFYVFTARGSVQIPATRVGRDLGAELLTLDFHPNTIAPGPGLLLLVYSGQVNETESHGLFAHRSQKAARRLPAADDLGLATHMEPSFARRLFPGWDEPHLKARFSLIVVLPFRGYETISNMPVKRKSISLSCAGEPLQEIEFQTSPAMSSYLVTLVVGRFEHIEALTANQCKVRAYFYAPGEQPNQRRQAAQMALRLAVDTFDRLEALLGVRYPLSKFDMIALRDFNSGGMENWGAAIFHENYLLFDNSSQNVDIRVNGGANRPKRLVVPLVVAHEIAHQWFGNLITARAWAYLWLNEGFAQLLMYELAHELFPRAHYWRIFLEDNRQAAAREDELVTSSRALEPPADGPAGELLDLFDQLTYNKGAALLRMLQAALGRGQFVAGLRHYLLKHAYDSVTSRDLWQALEEADGRPERQLESLMADWLRLEGLPVLALQVTETADQYVLRLSQERFTLLPAEAARAPGQAQQPFNWSHWSWAVPIGLASEARPQPEPELLRLWAPHTQAARQAAAAGASWATPTAALLTERQASLALPRAALGRWFKLNFEALGYFRVDYAAPAAGQVDMLARLRRPLRDQSLGAPDRFNLHDDLFAMVLAGRKSVAFYLRYLGEAFDEETETLVLRSMLDALDRIRAALVSNSQQAPELGAQFDAFVQGLLKRLWARQLAGPGAGDWAAARGAPERPQANESVAGQPAGEAQFAAPGEPLSEQLELLEASRMAYNEPEAQQRAADLLQRHLLQRLSAAAAQQRPPVAPATPATGAAANKSALDLTSREHRAAVYSVALNREPGGQSGGARQSAGLSNALATAASHLLPTVLSSATRPRPPLAESSAATSGGRHARPPRATAATSAPEPSLFRKLLEVYETSESSQERQAVCLALGGVRDPARQADLLNLTLAAAPFRPQDAGLVLDALARSRSGRQLIWAALVDGAKALAARQLVGLATRSLARGLVEPAALAGPRRPAAGQQQPSAPPAADLVERQLRELYKAHGHEHGKLIGQAIEWVRINTAWFKRDHDNLVRFLNSAPAAD